MDNLVIFTVLFWVFFFLQIPNLHHLGFRQRYTAALSR